ncbi:beta-galactosidase-1-like protein 2 [Liolophura sinensis]|uniref:beta-galactosidase-1-like protein 2 n=1 Tax=Liolophura sinensis TaxID=3198878 RepID=UPI00315848E5
MPEGFEYDFTHQNSSLKLRNRHFMLDGKPLTILSGSIHYFRVPMVYWKDRLLKLKAAGLNTVETYVAWNKHEERRGHFTMADNLDLRRFIKLSRDVGLYMILRPGPYICAEWDMGGLPSWLLHDPTMKMRTNHPPYMDAVRSYFRKLLPKVVDLQYSRGGPIIMVQVENEFGSYSDEVEHLQFIAQTLRANGIQELLVVSESREGVLRAPLPQALLTVNFQKASQGEVLLDLVRRSNPDVPLMVMEFWTGWFDHWDREHQVVGTERLMESLQYILTMQSSVNFYMFHGGTNFGFFAGANHFDKYRSDVTSYDYGALLTEAGDVTRKFKVIKTMLMDLVLKPQGIHSLPDPPPDVMKAAYGDVAMDFFLSWANLLRTVEPIRSKSVVAMEMLDINNNGGQAHGYIVYRHVLSTGGVVRFGAVHDRAQVLLNGIQVAVVNCTLESNRVHLPDVASPTTLDIMVENQGRVNYFSFKSNLLNNQRKGLVGDVLLSNTALQDWEIFPLEFNDTMLYRIEESPAWQPFVAQSGVPCMYRGKLRVDDTTPRDTFLNMKGWTKGVVFINGFNLGRYWKVGPQVTLYVPAPVLKSGVNEVLIFEEHSAGKTIRFQRNPVLHVD